LWCYQEWGDRDNYLWRETRAMKYLFAWILGVPGLLIFIWFCMNHC